MTEYNVKIKKAKGHSWPLLKVLRNYIEYLIRTRNVKYLTLDEVKEMRKKSHD